MNQLEKKLRVFVGRRQGASPEKKRELREALATQVWWGECRNCGRTFKGTPAQLVEHECYGPESQ